MLWKYISTEAPFEAAHDCSSETDKNQEIKAVGMKLLKKYSQSYSFSNALLVRFPVEAPFKKAHACSCNNIGDKSTDTQFAESLFYRILNTTDSNRQLSIYVCRINGTYHKTTELSPGDKSTNAQFAESLFYRMRDPTNLNRQLSVYVCRICSYTSTCSTTLKLHVRSHTGERDKSTDTQFANSLFYRMPDSNQQCTCFYSSPGSTILGQPFTSHTEEPPFRCEECGEGFKLRHHLLRHFSYH
ncbi:hypothetical protein TNIN_152401 [Trichonephila inaurata madagascariensis]|uniref:C2H2-type domain-containing protein n=1 Tax=Trichonephila inaurata madagascariensis TaxID=2747483 RepID=A0A8X6YBE7_9ARAC|nr:hypothetical protein TNIN_152401 [Trichonephila inaurata madagascariensis]